MIRMLEMWFLTCFNSKFFLSKLEECRKDMPMLFVIGDRDQFTDVKSFRKFILTLQHTYLHEKIEALLVEDTDHFWRYCIYAYKLDLYYTKEVT